VTNVELKAARTRLGLTQAGLAALLRVDGRTIRKWEAGDREIPGTAEVALEALADGWRPKHR
jgi:DNA-binding transcriptional regulator YiaG